MQCKACEHFYDLNEETIKYRGLCLLYTDEAKFRFVNDYSQILICPLSKETEDEV
jgi:hypothetical protein